MMEIKPYPPFPFSVYALPALRCSAERSAQKKKATFHARCA
jgi:hypothetical protein